MRQITFGSGCSGIGSPEVAWHDGLGWKSMFVSEIEPYPSQVLKRHWPGTPNLGDFTKIDGRLLKCDVFVAGTPCQSFSFAGRREGLNDARGNLTLTFVDIVHAIKSLFCSVWENVPGVLSDKTNAFGCLLGGLVGADDPLIPCAKPADGKSTDFWRWYVPDDDSEPFHVPRWTDAGMVAGPLGRAAWRVFDAQYFGLAQRRERVLVVFCPATSLGDPAAILFEPKGVQGHFEESAKARKDIAGTLTPGAHPGGYNGQDAYNDLLVPAGVTGTLSASTQGGGGLGTDFELAGGLQVVSDDLSPSLRAQAQHSHRLDSAAVVASAMAFGGGNRSGPLDVTATLTAKGNRQDFEVETFITQPLAHTLRGEGFDASEDGTGRGTPLGPVAFSHQAGGKQTTLGYDEKSGLAPSLGASTTPAVAYSVALRGREGGGTAELGGEVAGTQRASQGGGDKPHVLTMAVRRLTPPECHRLQGFPDGHCNIGTKKPTPDGPQYKGLGNSMAVKMMRWIGERIEKDFRRVEGL